MPVAWMHRALLILLLPHQVPGRPYPQPSALFSGKGDPVWFGYLGL